MLFGIWLTRMMCSRSDKKRDRGLTVPEDIQVLTDIAYGGESNWQVMDIYRPKEVQGRLSVIVSFHGGGWVYGDKEVYKYYCMSLAQQGFAVIDPSYRLAPEYPFPAGFEDMCGVFRFAAENADKYGFDTENIFAVGDSSGGMGLAAFACLVTDKVYAERLGIDPPEGIHLNAIGLNCARLTTKGKEGIFRGVIPEGKERYIGLMHIPDHITAEFPPCHIITADDDFLKDEPQELIPILEKFGTEYRYKLYEAGNNRLGHVFHCNIKDERARAANTDQLEFFRAHIKLTEHNGR